MKSGAAADGLYLTRIVELVALIDATLKDITFAGFAADRDKAEVTAFRIAMIGETSRKVLTELKERHPNIPWRSIARTRNIIVHHYEQIDRSIIWQIANDHLGSLEATCRLELERLDNP